jgi:redox-sensitive bicupin YhaK (pirin superfamily)
MQGALSVNEQSVSKDQALFIEQQDTLEIMAKSSSEFMLCFGVPHNEPIRQYGPFVD